MDNEQLEWALSQRLIEVRDTLRSWLARIKSPEEVMSNSSLATDDRVYPGMPCSQLAWWGLTVGVEHLDASIGLLDRQIEQGQPIMPSATYTVLRGALIGASQAALLLCTPQRAQRVNYGLKIAYEEYRQAYNFRETTVHHSAISESERQRVLSEDFLSDFQEGMARVKTLLKERNEPQKRLLDTDLIKEAARVVHQDSNADMLRLAVEMEWRLGSGAAHGRLLMNMHRQASYSKSDTGHIGHFGGTKREVTQQIVLVYLVLHAAWSMWDLRRFSNR